MSARPETIRLRTHADRVARHAASRERGPEFDSPEDPRCADGRDVERESSPWPRLQRRQVGQTQLFLLLRPLGGEECPGPPADRGGAAGSVPGYFLDALLMEPLDPAVDGPGAVE